MRANISAHTKSNELVVRSHDVTYSPWCKYLSMDDVGRLTKMSKVDVGIFIQDRDMTLQGLPIGRGYVFDGGTRELTFNLNRTKKQWAIGYQVTSVLSNWVPESVQNGIEIRKISIVGEVPELFGDTSSLRLMVRTHKIARDFIQMFKRVNADVQNEKGVPFPEKLSDSIFTVTIPMHIYDLLEEAYGRNADV